MLIQEKNLVKIPIKSLIPSQYNTYGVEDDSVRELKESIKSVGLLAPLTVMKHDKTYSILSGERRYTALSALDKEGLLEELGINNIPCYVFEDENLTVGEQKLVIETSNLEVRDFQREHHRFHLMQILLQMVEDGEIEERKFAARFAEQLGTSNRYARYYRQVFKKGVEKVQDLVKAGKLSIGNASQISSLPAEQQNKLADEIEKSGQQKVLKELRQEKAKENAKDSRENNEKTLHNVQIEEGRKGQEIGEIREDKHFDAKSEKKIEEKTEIVVEESKPNEEIITKEEIARYSDMDLDDENDMFTPKFDLSIDTVGEFKKLNSRNEENDKAQYQARLKSIVRWCESIMENDIPSPEEWHVIEACKEVADKFL